MSRHQMPDEARTDWTNIRARMQQLGKAIAPLMGATSPPSWAVSMRFVMDVAEPEIEKRCAEVNGGDC